MIHPATVRDAEEIAGIYNHYIANTVITFEEQIVTPEQMAARIETVGSSSLPWLVAERDGQLLGYAYAAPWKARSAYRFSVETTVYLHPETLGRGIGSLLYETLFSDLERRGVRTAIGGIALPNPASVALHEKLGMKKAAHFERVGFKFDQWIDVGYWQINL
ncbi:MAG: GNAT family N-acetyltransferase [Acidihalobacter sp.]|uniref:arsinothricin resistance N-acetyltransferase ArsN1 family B n=1 Tax=Acidihalobacter sp. TaxID=1872108 RepID=UPI00307DA06B